MKVPAGAYAPMKQKKESSKKEVVKEKEPSTAVLILIAAVIIIVIVSAFVMLNKNSVEDDGEKRNEYALPEIQLPPQERPAEEHGPAQDLLPSKLEFPTEWVQGFTLSADKNLIINVSGYEAGHALIYERKNAHGGMTTTTLHGADVALFTTAADAQVYYARQKGRMKGKDFTSGSLKTCFVTFTESKSSVRGFFVCQEEQIVFELFIITPKIGDEVNVKAMFELMVKTASAVQGKITGQR